MSSTSLGWEGRRKSWESFIFFPLFPFPFCYGHHCFQFYRFFFPSTPIHWYLPRPVSADGFFLFRHVSGTAVIILLPIEGVKCIVSPWMYHLLWEKWAAEQIKNNLIWKRKSKSKAGGARLLRSSKCRKQYFGIAGAEILSKNTV